MTWGQGLIFNHCGRGFRMVSVLDQCICTLAATVLTLKYQLVASSMSRYVTGNLENLSVTTKTKAAFFLLKLWILVTLIVYVCFAMQKSTGEKMK